MKVAIVKSSNLPPFEAASTAMTASLAKQPVQPEVLTFDLGGDSANAAAVLLEVDAASPHLVVTVGTLATEMMVRAPGTVPVIFSMVLYPVQSGFLRPSTHPVSGVSLDIPPSVQFDYLRQLLPDARRVGVLYSPQETDAIVGAGRNEAERFGFELRSRVVNRSAEVVDALGRLLPEIDALWSVADSNVFTPQTTPALILNALRRGVPLFGISIAQARAGAVMALSTDYSDIGRQTAEYVARALAGEKVSDLPVASPRTIFLTLNERSARHIGLTLPPQLRDMAIEVLQ